jgi:hypothetical protein
VARAAKMAAFRGGLRMSTLSLASVGSTECLARHW